MGKKHFVWLSCLLLAMLVLTALYAGSGKTLTSKVVIKSTTTVEKLNSDPQLSKLSAREKMLLLAKERARSKYRGSVGGAQLPAAKRQKSPRKAVDVSRLRLEAR